MPLYTTPDIRKQTIEQAEQFLIEKRARRMVLAQSFLEKTCNKIKKLQASTDKRFNRQVELFENNQQRVVELLNKMSGQLERINELHSEATNIEAALEENKCGE
jgi:uncharacterized protein YkwD